MRRMPVDHLGDSWGSGFKALLQIACFCVLTLAICLLSGGVAAVSELAPGSTPQQWLFAATPLSVPLLCLLGYCFCQVRKIRQQGGGWASLPAQQCWFFFITQGLLRRRPIR